MRHHDLRSKTFLHAVCFSVTGISLAITLLKLEKHLQFTNVIKK